MVLAGQFPEEAIEMATTASMGSVERKKQTLGGRALMVLVGVAGIVIGVVVLADPNRTLDLIAIGLGIYLVGWGMVTIAHREDQEGRWHHAISLVLGVAGVGAGVTVLLRPDDSLRAIVWASGVYFIASGVVGLVQAAPRRVEREALRATVAVVDLLMGVIVVSWPGLGLQTFALVLGVYLILRGVGNLGLSISKPVGRVTGQRPHEGSQISSQSGV